MAAAAAPASGNQVQTSRFLGCEPRGNKIITSPSPKEFARVFKKE
jgi:hypothetical protein